MLYQDVGTSESDATNFRICPGTVDSGRAPQIARAGVSAAEAGRDSMMATQSLPQLV